MRVIFIRHAEPNYEIDSLTEKGWREAALLAERVSQWKVDDFYVSPLGRAQDTASLTLKKMGRTAVTMPWMREFDAPVIDPVTKKSRIPWDLMPSYWTGIPEFFDVEKFADAGIMTTGPVKEEYRGVTAALDEWLASYGYVREGKSYRVAESNDKTIVCFCHMGVTLVFLSHLLNISPVCLLQGFFLPPSSVTVVQTEEREDGIACFRCQMAGSTSHLWKDGEPVSHMGAFSQVFHG